MFQRNYGGKMEAGNKEEQAPEVSQEAPKLSRLDALEVAHKTIEDTNERSAAPSGDTSADTGKTDESRGANGAGGDNKQPVETIEPPAQWSKDEKTAFFEMDSRGRAAALRIHRAQQQYHSRELERIRAEDGRIKEEEGKLEWARRLADQVEPFVKTRGDKRPTYEQIVDALKLVNEFDSNPQKAAADILKAKGFTPPGDWDRPAEPGIEDKIKPVLDRVSTLEGELEQARKVQVANTFVELGTRMQATRNAAGTSRFPDFNDTESGITLASQMGSLIRGEHEHSAGFVAYLRAKVPGAASDPLQALEEAYKWFGGKVDDSAEAPRPSDPQKHLIKSNRAASSVPGRGMNGTTSGSPVKKVNRLEALRRGLEQTIT
jgi:hypothetical protein